MIARRVAGILAHRLAWGLPTLFVIVTLSFFLIRLAPGGPFDAEQPLEAKIVENLRRIYQLDRPWIEQYGLYLAALLRGDFGPSLAQRDFSVADLFRLGLPVSMALGAIALGLALVVGVALGSAAALKPNSRLDYAVTALATLGATLPSFVTAPLLQIVFGLMLGLTPIAGWGGGAARNLVLPVVVLALPQIAIIARLARAGLVETLQAPHVRTMHALGLPDRMILPRAARQALLPVVSYLGPAAAGLLTGSLVVETIFGLPGIGRYFAEGALNRDYTLVMGTVIVVAAFILVFNALVDVATALLDPRVRL